MIASTIIIIGLCILIYIIATRWRLHSHIVRLYGTTFGHEPDEISLDRWIYNWRGDAQFMRFHDEIEESRRASANERIIITGLCQDHGRESIENWLPIAEYIGSCFHDYRILVVENDSIDDTREYWIEQSRRNAKILILCDDDMPLNVASCRLGIRSDGDKERNLEARINRMAMLRDLYLRRIVRKWSDYEYMLVIDWDLIGHLATEGVFHALSWIRDGRADVMAVNSLYLDKQKQWQVFDTFPLLDHYKCHDLHEKKRLMDKMTSSMWHSRLVQTLNEPIQVKSAFGGMAIYNLKAVFETGSNYLIPYEERVCNIQCEHTSFHRFLRVFIDPWFVLLLKKNLH